MTTLQALEEWMLTTITHPQGVLAGVAQASETAIAPSVTSAVCTTVTWSAEERLGIYWNAYFARLHECLREEFPVLRQALGDDVFDEFAFEYLQTHPPTSYTLSRLGSQLPAFLAASRPHREGEVPDWADFLADLAAFEWTLSEVFDGPGPEGFEARSLSGFERVVLDCLVDAKVACASCLRLKRYQFPVHLYHAEVKRGNHPDLPEPQPSFVALTRRAFTVQHHTLDEIEFALLQRLLAGDSLGLALEKVGGNDKVILVEVGTQIAGWFQTWVHAGFITGLTLPDSV